ncbi:hypothetical protein DMUE_3723 [Dictyocoela muelleri]|nr:hypothetical protein DMUE_3723 [Dictyocoela muelleri]
MHSNLTEFIYSSKNEDIFNFVIEKEIFRKQMICISFKSIMILKKSEDSHIGYSWKCSNYLCARYKIKKRFLKIFFLHVKIDTKKLLAIFYYLSPGALINENLHLHL